jgi:hypothetical protein
VVHSRRQQGCRNNRLRVFTRTSYKHRQRTDSDLTITDSMKAAAAIVIASEHDESSPRSQVTSLARETSARGTSRINRSASFGVVADSIQGLACAALGSLSPISYTRCVKICRLPTAKLYVIKQYFIPQRSGSHDTDPASVLRCTI